MSCFPALKGQPKVILDKGGKEGKAMTTDEKVKVDKCGEKAVDEGVHDRDGGARKKRKKTIFDTSPRDYNAEIFRANNPFVVLVETSTHTQKFPNDKVADGQKMDKRALLAAIRAVVKSTALSSYAYKHPRTETGGRIIHGSMAMDLWMITSPSTEPPQRTLKDLAAAITRKPGNRFRNEPEAQEDVTVKIGEMKSLQQDSSVESITVVHEEDDRPEDRTRSDIRFYPRDKRILDMENLVLALLVECKWDGLSRTVLFQAAAYVAKKYALKNMKKGRFDPIYLQGWAEQAWCYGIFYLFGVVEVRGGRVVSTTRHTVAEMQASLERATQELRRISGDEAAVYPDETYVSGTLYVPHEAKFSLPDMKLEGGLISSGAKLFFQALFRIIVGDKVLKWSEDDVRQVVDLREKMLADKIEMGMREF